MPPINFEKKFVVALFDDGLEIVPAKWLSADKQKCSFPKTTSAKRMKLAAKGLEDPKSNWNVYDVKHIYASSDSYKRGLEKMEKANYESDGFTSTDIECRNEDSDTDNSCIFTEKYPDVPESLKSQITIPETSMMSQSASNNDVQTPKSEPGWKDVMRTLGMLKYRMEILMDNQNEILKRLDKRTNENEPKDKINIDEIPSLPLNSEEGLNILEQKLNDDKVKKYMIAELKKFGGHHPSEIIRRIMMHLMTDELGTEFSFMGLKGKKSFSSLMLCNIIFDVVRIHFPEVTNKESGKLIANWLRHATERKNKKNKPATNPISDANTCTS